MAIVKGQVTPEEAAKYASTRVGQQPTGPTYEEHYNWALDPANYPGQLEQHIQMVGAELKAAAQAKAAAQIQTGQQQLLGQVGAGREEFQAGQAASEADLLKRYTEALGGQESMEAMYQRMSGELGLPQLREERMALSRQVAGLEETLAGMPEQVAGETRGYDVSARQQARLEQARADPFREQLIQMGRRAGLVGEELTGAEAQLGTRMGLTQAQQEKMLKPYAMEKDILSERTARENVGYNLDSQAELDFLLNRIEAGESLSAEERARAHSLAVLEQTFHNQQQLLIQQAEIAETAAEKGYGYQTGLLGEQARLAEVAAGPAQQRQIALLQEQARIVEEAAGPEQKRKIALLQEQARLAGVPTAVTTAGGNVLLINAETGQILANLGAATVAGGGGGDEITFDFGDFIPTGPTEPKPTWTPSTGGGGSRGAGASGSW